MNRRTTLAVAISALAAAWLPHRTCRRRTTPPTSSCPTAPVMRSAPTKDAPIVGAGNPNQSPGSNNLPGQLDLIPGNGDQYGARYAAEHSPRLLPGNCP